MTCALNEEKAESTQSDQRNRCPHEETLHPLALQNATSEDFDQFVQIWLI